MADTRGEDNGTSAQRRYNLRTRKATSVTRDPQAQHATKPFTSRLKKAEKHSSDDFVPSQMARKLTFFDLPAEIRNDIYIRVLHAPIVKPAPKNKRFGRLPAKYLDQNLTKAQTLEMRRYDRSKDEIKATKEPIGNDGVHWYPGCGLYTPYSFNEPMHPLRSWLPEALLHKDPILWQVSRHVRQEVRSH